MGSLQQDLWEAGSPNQSGAMHSAPTEWHKSDCTHKILHRRQTRRPSALQPCPMSCPVEDRGLVSGKMALPRSYIAWRTFQHVSFPLLCLLMAPSFLLATSLNLILFFFLPCGSALSAVGKASSSARWCASPVTTALVSVIARNQRPYKFAKWQHA